MGIRFLGKVSNTLFETGRFFNDVEKIMTGKAVSLYTHKFFAKHNIGTLLFPTGGNKGGLFKSNGKGGLF